jgi:hypothetical protein
MRCCGVMVAWCCGGVSRECMWCARVVWCGGVWLSCVPRRLLLTAAVLLLLLLLLLLVWWRAPPGGPAPARARCLQVRSRPRADCVRLHARVC